MKPVQLDPGVERYWITRMKEIAEIARIAKEMHFPWRTLYLAEELKNPRSYVSRLIEESSPDNIIMLCGLVEAYYNYKERVEAVINQDNANIPQRFLDIFLTRE